MSSISIEKRRLMEMILNKKRSVSRVVRQEISKRETDQETQLSFAQQRLWFLDELTPGNAAYAFCNIVRFDGKIDILCLQKSYNEIINRHENLRTTFKVVDGIPSQVISENIVLEIPTVEFGDISESEQESQLQALAVEEAKKPFSLSNGPLIRLFFVKITDEKYAVLQTMHHIVYDGWSLAVLFDELKRIYEAFIVGKNSPLEPLSIQYADFALWQRSEIETKRSIKQFEYWKSVLSGSLPTLNLPTDRSREPLPTYSGQMQWFHLSKSLSNQLENLAKREDATLFMLLLASFSILLQRYTGEDDIIVGTPIANRNNKQIESLIGFFVNSLVMRNDLSGNPEFCSFLEKIKEVASGAYQNQDYPFEKLVSELQPERHINQNPIFQVMFALQNTPPPPSNINNVKLSLEEVDSGTAVFDITLSLYQDEKGISGYFEYSTELFDNSTIRRMVENYKTLLSNIVENPEEKINNFSILPRTEYRKIVADWSSNDKSLLSNKCLHQLIEQQAIQRPDQYAVVDANNTLTYAELNEKANRLARKLRESGVNADDIVGICLRRSVDMFVCILAVLKSGGAYLPLDPDYPKERLTFMVQDSSAKIIITITELKDHLSSHKIQTLYLDKLQIDKYSSDNIEDVVARNNLAYIIYTSGSTGQPKGVMIEQRNIVNSTLARMTYYSSPVTKFLLLSSFSFDSSIAGIFWTLCQGGELHLPENGMERDIHYVASKIKSIGVSHILSLPSVYGLLMSVSEKEQLISLKTVIVAGEACPPELVDTHLRDFPNVSLYNEYGPTEGSVWSTVYKLSADNWHKQQSQNLVPIGNPIPSVKTYILDRHLNPVPIGVVGEIYIAGQGVARGYLNQKALTAEKFILSPFDPQGEDRIYRTGDLAKFQSDGNILFLGRTDNQVKIRGYRIELGEIETALLKHEAIKEAVVIAQEVNSGTKGFQNDLVTNELKTKRLASYLVYSSEFAPTTESIQALLKQSLPDYMVPQFYTFVDKIPLSPNGKVDFDALSKEDLGLNRSSQEFVEASNEIERKLTAIWRSVLAVDQIGVHDNFFEIGGDSILSIQIIARTKEAGIHLTPRQIFQNLTISELALVAETESSIIAEQGAVTGNVNLIPIQHWFFERNLKNLNHWNQSAMLRVPKTLNMVNVSRALDCLMKQHDALRAHFTEQSGTWIQTYSNEHESIDIQTSYLSSLGELQRNQAIQQIASTLQESLDIGNGKLLAATYIQMGQESPDNRLLIVVHHLAIDIVSWTPLIEDLETAYKQLCVSKTVELPEKTSSFSDWSNALQSYVATDLPKSEVDYWLSLPNKDVFEIPLDFIDGRNIEESQRKLTVCLSVEETQVLLKDIPQVYNTKIDDILLTAMAMTINSWTGCNILSLGMEGHGREQIGKETDLSRTVGWFTSYFPIALRLDEDLLGDAIKSVKEQLRAIPNHGIGFGLLRYLSHDNEIVEQLGLINQENILYNYLGRIGSNDQKEATFRLTDEDCGNNHDLSAPRTHQLEIDSMICNNQLKLDWVYSENLHQSTTIQNLANCFIEFLRELIVHCQSPAAGGVSASDFPEADLDQNDLADLLDMLED